MKFTEILKANIGEILGKILGKFRIKFVEFEGKIWGYLKKVVLLF